MVTDKQLVFNAWQKYDCAHGMYDRHMAKGIHKLKQVNDRNNVFEFKVYEIDNDVMITATNSREINFIFLGSNDIEDWFNNFDAEKIDVDGYSFHKGFYESADKFIALINVILSTLSSDIFIINFIGHSRGGALALLAAILFSKTAKDPLFYDTSVITYGQPRVSDYRLADLIKEYMIEYHRVFFIRDIVCDVPPIEMGYEHPWNSPIHQLPGVWWHRFRFLFKRVHSDYARTINTIIYKQIIYEDKLKWDRI